MRRSAFCDPQEHQSARDQVFQVNRAIFTAPVTEDQVVTKKGDRLYVQVALHDWTGSAIVHVQDQAAPSLYGCESTEEVLQKAQSGDLKVECGRFNLRGVRRQHGVTIKKFVADICSASFLSTSETEAPLRTPCVSLPKTPFGKFPRQLST